MQTITFNRENGGDVDLGSGWQPIETAPTDGTWFLAYGPEAVSTWDDETGHQRVPAWVVVRDDGRGEGFWDGYYDPTTPGPFTHWMPLPEPPEA